LINDYTQLQVLRSIAEDISQPKIAKKIGYSVGKVNFIIKALAKKGLIKERISLAKKFVQRKKAEYEELQRELEVDSLRYGDYA